jgi:hypothetical protein
LICKVSSCAAILMLGIAFALTAALPGAGILRPALAQTYNPALTPPQLDTLLAPIALYPDPLLAQVLMASTYPDEVAQAAAWQQIPGNAALTGPALEAAAAQLPFDPSVKALLQFPQVLQMLAANVTWLQQLGQAFIAQQADVSASVQRLRHLALAAGTLVSAPQQTVLVEGDIIAIEPATPQTVFMPIYNPEAVYGAWPYPDGPPEEFPPPPGYAFGLGIGFGLGYAVVEGLWGWGHWDWRRHEIRIDRDRYDRIAGGHGRAQGETWHHDWGHAAVRAPAYTPAARQDFRGFNRDASAPPRNPPALESFGRGAEVRAQSLRGRASRASPPVPIRSAPAHVGGGARGGGGGGHGGGGRR